MKRPTHSEIEAYLTEQLNLWYVKSRIARNATDKEVAMAVLQTYLDIRKAIYGH